jgi:hypothetical protein
MAERTTNVEMRQTTVGALVAEMLEAEADAMPPSYSKDAAILRSSAAEYRLLNTKPIWVRIHHVPVKDDDF